MPNASVLDKIVFSGLNHIDALLDHGPDWNYQTPAGNVITYTFSVTSGNEAGETGQQAFSVSQQANARSAMAYISSLTGIVFAETANGAAASVHLCYIDIPDVTTSGLCSWQGDASIIVSTNELVSYKGSAYIYLDNRQFGTQNSNLTPGGAGYETLLHELGHMLGLKHPFEVDEHNANVLPFDEDNSSYTLMSYRELGGPYSTFSAYDIAALDWLYGRDGLAGALGVGSATGARYLTGSFDADILVGTSANDTLRGNGGDDRINGGAGEDTAIFTGLSSFYNFSEQSDGTFRVQGSDGIDILSSIEILQFSNGSFRRAQLADTSAPGAPSTSVSTNAAGYVAGNTPFVAGTAEAGASVRVFAGATQIGFAVADANGAWKLSTSTLLDGSYSIVATATDAAGNTSASSAPISFKVDARAPAIPTGSATLAAGSNQPSFAGTGEAGTTLTLVDISNVVIGQTVIDSTGKWSIAPGPLANGNYSIVVASSDSADNSARAASNIAFAIDNALNRVGTAGNDSLSGTAGNNALSGLAGTDTAVYAGTRAGYTVADAAYGYTITAKSGADGQDSLVGIERIRFADAHVAIDIDGVGGQAYRLYQAAYDRAPDTAGVGFWMAKMDQGVSFSAVAAAFLDQPEFISLYGANASNTTFVGKLYQHVLHRPLDQAGADFWVGQLDRGTARGEVLKGFSESGENVAQLVGTIQNGFEYTPYLG